MLLFSIAAFSQKKRRLPPPPPPPKVLNTNVEKPSPPEEMKGTELAVPPALPKNNLPPPPAKIKEGHSWTRNGQDVWVVKHHKPTNPVTPPPPPPPPAPPKKGV